MFLRINYIVWLICVCLFSVKAQHNIRVCGVVTSTEPSTEIINIYLENTIHKTTSDSTGKFCLNNLEKGTYNLVAYTELHEIYFIKIKVNSDTNIAIKLKPEAMTDLSDVVFNSRKADFFGISKMPDYEGTSIYAGKKTEVVTLDRTTANISTNNARQVFSRVSGLNIWESDAAGLQLGIGARGLSPNRTANFNVRQNGYDISADALGYPESYYTPPLEAIEKVEFIRGAASLQYGTQLGGMVNFVFKQGPKDKKIEYQGRLTGGSYGFYNSFNSLGGTIGKTNYYIVYQNKGGHSFRPNSEYAAQVGYLSVAHQFNKKMKLTFNYTHENYLAHQPGGLTDAQFAKDYTVSNRKRNWFAVNWNLPALNLDYNITKKTVLNWRFFTLLASRKSIGFLNSINQRDDGSNRTYIYDRFQNTGSEFRVLHHYTFLNHKNTFVIGGRAYKGLDIRKQGEGSNGSDADFRFLNPDSLEKFDYRLPSKNYALFAENIIKINPRLSITPGIRYELIKTSSIGYVRNRIKNLIGQVVVDKFNRSNTDFVRGVWLYGTGASAYLTKDIELYANYTKNFRAATFSDLIVSNPNYVVDSLLKDERGFNADLGFRGFVKEFMHFDASIYWLYYNNRIGQIFLPTGQNFTTNIGKSSTKGIELMGEIDLLRLFYGSKYKSSFSYFINTTFNDARYLKGNNPQITNKKVEFVPNATVRTGLAYQHKTISMSIQYSSIANQYSDAINTQNSTKAIEGLIPSYYVLDFSMKYQPKRYYVGLSINNFTNNKYFTRRANSYPGPGIIPSDPIQAFITLGVKL